MTTSEAPFGAARSGPPTPREMNKQMVARLLATPAEPIPSGGYGLRVLEHRGRDSGRAHHTPVGVLAMEEHSYLVCPDRTRDWPRNLEHQPRCAILGSDRRDALEAHSVAGEEGIDAVATYLSVVQAPWALRAFGLPDDPSREQVADAMPRMIVFRLTAEEKVGSDEADKVVDVASAGPDDARTTEQES